MTKLLIFITSLFSLNAYSWTLVADPSGGVIKFSTNEVTLNVSSDSCDGTGFSNSEMLDLLDEAMDEFWHTASSSAIVIKKGSVVSTSIANDGDTAADLDKIANNTILVACTDSATRFPASSSTAGLGGITKFTDGKVVGRVFISRNNSTVINLSARQRLALLAHEVGHALGLGHSENKISLMYFSLGTKLQEHITRDDMDGVTYLYPHDSLPGSCGSVIMAKNVSDIFKNKDHSDSGNSGNPGAFFITLFIGFGLATLLSLLPASRV